MSNTQINVRRASRAQLPKFWRPKLDESTVRTVKVAHHDLVHRLETGTADENDFWDWIETGFTYSHMAQLLAKDGVQFTPDVELTISAQIAIYPSVQERVRKTGRVGLSGPELKIARDAAALFDALIELDRNGIAVAAVKWSDKLMLTVRKKLIN